VKGDELVSQEVVAGLDAARDRKGDLASVRDHGVDSPKTRRGIVTVLIDLEPR